MKRERSSQKSSSNAQKRQKLDSASAPPAKRKAASRKIRLDDLQWKEVTMPDRLEDFEGFYGLEEIDDVEVVKDESGMVSFTTTRTEEDVEREKEEGKKAEEEKLAELERMRAHSNGEDRMPDEDEENKENEDEEENEGSDDSWEGFSDDDGKKNEVLTSVKENGHILAENDIEDINDASEEQHETVKPNKKEKKKKEKKQKLEEKVKSQDEEEQASDDEEDDRETIGNGAFDILANRQDDEDDEVDISAWEELGLSQNTLEAISSLKFSEPTPIQATSIPEILAGRDVVGKASTGSGKTLAFGIPILETFLANLPASKKATPLALIISPTRELAHQISAHLTKLCSGGDFDAPFIATITGGLSVQKQRRQLEKANIVIGTPGRLWEVISSGQGLMESFKRVRFLVIDEADRLLSEGHYKEFGEILKIFEADDENPDTATEQEDTDAPETTRQTLIFSATFHKGLQQKLTGGKRQKGSDLMNQQESMDYLLKKIRFQQSAKPKFIDANPESQMASGLKEGLVECAGTEKDLYLYSLLLFHPKKRALVFTNSVSAVRRLTPYLQNLNLPAVPLHSGMMQKARLRSIERFTQRPGSILVATDVAARGLDIPNVDLIVHYHLPRAADTYVHRSGRTARGAASGLSILICGPEEVAGVRRLVAKVHARSSAADASSSKKKSKKTAFFIRTLDIDRKIVAKLKPRATLSKKISDATAAKEKKHSEDDWMRAAAEELGVDYDSESFDKEAKGKRGRGSGRKAKEKEAREMSKGELQGLRAELKSLLAQRVNVGVSERYLTSGRLDVDKLMSGEGNLEFLGDAGGFGFDDDDDEE